MPEKRILLASADTEDLAEYRRVFGDAWEVTTAVTGPATLAELQRQPQDVLLADLDLPEIDGDELLNRVRKEFPKTLCFILARDSDRERVMKNVVGAHQFLSKPCDITRLKSNVERALSLDVWIASNSMRELVARVRTFPTVPSLYLEVLSVLRSPHATTGQVGTIIAKDMAMMTKLLQVINSACFGLPRKISDPKEAVGIMGFEAVKSMVMTIKLLNQFDQIKPVYFSIDKLWRHSTDVARSARQLALVHTDSPTIAETAFTAGLIHDLGKVILAANFDEQYRGAQSLARKQNLPLCEVEREFFGASHGEIGAYLLGLWGMPLDLLEAAALHHQPSRSVTKGFTALTAVHVANALEHEFNPDKDEAGVVSKIDEAYLAEIGLLGKLDSWRDAILRRDFSRPTTNTATLKKPATVVAGKFEQPAKPAPMTATNGSPTAPAKEAPKPVTATAPAPAAVPAALAGTPSGNRYRLDLSWLLRQRQLLLLVMGTGLAACAYLGLFALLPSRVARERASALTAKPAADAPQANKNSATNDPSALIVRARTADAAAPAPPKPSPFNDLKLQGIFFTAKNPSAIINGNMVQIGDRVSGVSVVDITPSTVVLEYQSLRRTMTMK